MTNPQTVLVTGASGFIARHIVLQLLQAGYHVRGSVRDVAKGKDIRDTMTAHLGWVPDEEQLSFCQLDLMRDQGWQAAMQGVDAVLHTASPFPAAQPRDEDALIKPAVEGTLRALNAAQAAGVGRIVLTSSVAAVAYPNPMPDAATYSESDWTDVNSPACSIYSKSKTLAERAAWDLAKEHPEMQLTTINPGFVMGPPLDADFATSMDFVKRMMSGKDPAVPRVMFDFVDVRDIAKMHVAALVTPDTIGERLIGVAGPLWFSEVAQILQEAYPDRKISSRMAPNWFVRLLSVFDKEIQAITPVLGKRYGCRADKAKNMLAMDFIAPRDAVLAAADYLMRHQHIR